MLSCKKKSELYSQKILNNIKQVRKEMMTANSIKTFTLLIEMIVIYIVFENLMKNK